MAEYTIQELQEMLQNQIETETSQSAILSDLETSNSFVPGFIFIII